MNASAPRRRRPAASQPRGFILVTAMLFLVILTLLGLSLFRSSGLMDRISANTRDRQRAFESAQAALQFGEFWLGNGGGGPGSACSGMVNLDSSMSGMHTCSNGLANWTSVPWSNGYTMTPHGMNVLSGGGMASATDVNYFNMPGFYVEYEGLDPTDSSGAQIYQVTAYGYGGSADSVSVVRSTYKLTPATKPLDGL
jgi:type IV pilus assembly protein PilX